MLSSPFGLRDRVHFVDLWDSAILHPEGEGEIEEGTLFATWVRARSFWGSFACIVQGFFSLQPLSSRAQMMKPMMKTKIVNTTPHVLDIQRFGRRHLAFVPSMQEFMMRKDPNAIQKHRLVVGNQRIPITSNDLTEFTKIAMCKTPIQKLEYRVSEMRGSKDNIRDSATFDAVKKEASSRMKSIEKSHARLVMLSKQVKICPAQCQNLVQTSLKGVKEMKEAYNEKSEDDMWQLYNSKKPGQLISSLDKLLSTLGSIQDLLQACGINWYSMALVVSLPMPPPERMSSKFDILIKELHWNFETIHYALHLNRGVAFKWNERKFRYILDGPEVTVAEDMELEQSRRLASEDREHLLSQLENDSISVPGNPLLLGFKFATDHKLAAELQKRLEETAVLSNDVSSIPDCFWINKADLKLHRRLSGSRGAIKSVFEGEWCGQAVAIGITKDTDKAAVEKEAGLLLKVQHPNIVGFLGCAFTDVAPPRVRSRKGDRCSAGYLVMELMQEDLRRVIDRRARSHSGNPFTLVVTVDILFQIAAAMVHMHNLDIMHRDLKSGNCLVNLRSSSNSSSQVLKLIDFDKSKELVSNAPISNHTVNSGTRRWMAPEVWGVQISDANSSETPFYVPYTRSADVWSFGMTCYEVITGLLPFPECHSNTVIYKALRDGKRPLIPDSVSCDEGLKALMSRCWAQESSDRPDFKDIEKDLWTIKYQLEIQ